MKKFIISLLVGFIFIFSGSLITFYEFKDINQESITESSNLKTEIFKKELRINEINSDASTFYLNIDDRINTKSIETIEDESMSPGQILLEVEYYEKYVDGCYVYYDHDDPDYNDNVIISLSCDEEFKNTYELARDLFKNKKIPNRLKSVTIYINPKDSGKVEVSTYY